MRNSNKILFFTLFVVSVVFIFMLNQDEEAKEKRPMVAVSTFALYDITQHIAEESVKIVNIIPFGVDPHSFEPTPKLMAKIEKSVLVLYSGAGLEPWIHGYSFHNASINMSEHVSLRELGEEETEHHHEHEHGSFDPHYWLDFENMKKSTELITQELIKILPENKSRYLANKVKYIKMLENLNKMFHDRLQSCKQDTIIVNHNAFGYLSQKFAFHVEALSGLTPQAQASAKNMSHLIREIQSHKVTTVFAESFVSAKAMQSVADEAGVKVDVLQPLGNITADEASQHLSYNAIMKRNLSKIQKALHCQ